MECPDPPQGSKEPPKLERLPLAQLSNPGDPWAMADDRGESPEAAGLRRCPALLPRQLGASGEAAFPGVAFHLLHSSLPHQLQLFGKLGFHFIYCKKNLKAMRLHLHHAFAQDKLGWHHPLDFVLAVRCEAGSALTGSGMLCLKVL